MGKSAGGYKQLLKLQKGKASAFESAPIARKRHNVVGDRERGGKLRSTLQARSRSDQIRRETLLVEHQQKDRTNAFIDGRFGEDDQDMPHEDRLVHRFQRERQRQLRKSKYSLEDDGDGDGGGHLGSMSQLTHGGRALGDMEELSDADLGDSDNDDGRRGGGGFGDSDFVKGAHFGGGEEEEGGERPRSAKELLEETIAKYKLAKYERQEERTEQNRALQQLDEDFDEVRGLIFATGGQAKKAAQAAAAKAAAAGAHADFDQLAGELKGEMKAAPSDRLQTDSELAAAEARRLRGLEKERLLRMQPDGGLAGSARRPTDDDLDDGFGDLLGEPLMMGEKAQAKGGKDDDEDDIEEEEDEEEDEDDEESEEEEEDEEDEDEDEEGSDEDEDEEEAVYPPSAKAQKPSSRLAAVDAEKRPSAQTSAQTSAQATTAPSSTRAAPAELPYVFKCPSSPEELERLMDLAAGDPARLREILHRLIAGHHTKLREDNKPKLAGLAGLLVDRMMVQADLAASGASSCAGGDPPDSQAAAALMQPFCPSIYAISVQLPVQVALVIADRLQSVWARWQRQKAERSRAARAEGKVGRGKVGGGKGGGGKAGAGGMVPLPPSGLALVALCVQLYPVTDFRHAVLTPCALLVAEVLAQCPSPPPTGASLRRMLFLASCALQLIGSSNRWMPELHAMVCALIEAGLSPSPALGAAAIEPAAANPATTKAAAAKAAAAKAAPAKPGTEPPHPKALGFSTLGDADDADATGIDERGRFDALALAYGILRDLVRLTGALPAGVEVLAPTLSMLRAAEPSHLPAGLRALHDACAEEAAAALTSAARARLPLRMQRAPVVPLRQYNPAFEDDFQPDRSMDPNRDRAELQKLARKTKKEHKGAIRELRKDASFLAVERQKEREKRDAYLEGRGKRALQLLEEQEHAVKTMKKEKRKLGN